MPSHTRTPTLWELGHHPGRLVVRFSVVLVTAVTGINLLVTGRLGVAFDAVLVAICLTAPLWVRPGDFFTVGVLPPVLITATVVVLALAAPETIARPDDAFGQAVVSGLAHHGTALAIGYTFTLVLIGLRQVALRNHGIIRVGAIRAAVVEQRPGSTPLVRERRERPEAAPGSHLPVAPGPSG